MNKRMIMGLFLVGAVSCLHVMPSQAMNKAPSATLSVKKKQERSKSTEELKPVKNKMGDTTYQAIVTLDYEHEALTLECKLINMSPNTELFTLESYFFMETEERTFQGDKVETPTRLFHKEIKEFELESRKMVKCQVIPPSLKMVEAEVENKGGPTVMRALGDTLKGYVILLKYKEQVVAQQCSSKSLNKPEFLEMKVSPVSALPRYPK